MSTCFNSGKPEKITAPLLQNVFLIPLLRFDSYSGFLFLKTFTASPAVNSIQASMLTTFKFILLIPL